MTIAVVALDSANDPGIGMPGKAGQRTHASLRFLSRFMVFRRGAFNRMFRASSNLPLHPSHDRCRTIGARRGAAGCLVIL